MAYDTAHNPVTQAGFELGRMLFYDPVLSRDGTISCGFCHIQTSGFTQHGHPLSHGIDDRPTRRNSQPIQNMAWMKEFGWDGGVHHLDLFSVLPISDPNEMGSSMGAVVEKLNNLPRYRRAFGRAFGEEQVRGHRVLEALSQFMIVATSTDAPYDRYRQGLPGAELTPLELEGLSIFRDKCQTCHSGELFTDQRYHANGLPVFDTTDRGREEITLNPGDRYRFRTPSLRNVAITGPYMHDGRFRTLERVLEHYSEGVVVTPWLDAGLRPRPATGGRPGIPLTTAERTALLAFLHTLTDRTFLTDARLAEIQP